MMDNNKIGLENFESLLKKQNVRKPSLIYKNKVMSSKTTPLNSNEILSDVSKQIKLMQITDKVKINNNRHRLKSLKNSQLLSLNAFQDMQEISTTVRSSKQKFETQGVSDTQLIDMIENAENSHIINNVQPDFNETINDNSTKIKDQIENVIELSNKEGESNHYLIINKKMTSETSVSKIKAKDVCDIDSLSIVHSIIDKNVCKDMNKPVEIPLDIDCSEQPVSPVFHIKNVRGNSSSPSHLIYNLETFENFEKLAVPIIEENNDLYRAKQLINSQLLDKELHDHTHSVNINDAYQLSPIFHNQDFDNASKNGNTLVEYVTHTSKNDSVILKDEMLFSSDEEDDYICKKSFDLPITCALETSFYELPNELDKTMYVAFQTASNKTIEIKTESFNKAHDFYEYVNSNVCKEYPDNSSIVCSNSIKNKEHKLNGEKTDINRILYAEKHVIEESKCIESKKLNPQSFDLTHDASQKSVCNQLNLTATDVSKSFKGFRTANNKLIKLSDQAFARCKKVFQDIDFDENFKVPLDKTCNINDTQSKSTYQNERTIETPKYVDNVLIEEFKCDMFHESNVIGNRDFPSNVNSNKNITITDADLIKTENKFQDIDDDNFKNNCNRNLGFKTANFKNIPIYDKAKAKAKYIFKDIKENDKILSKQSTSINISQVFETTTTKKESLLKSSINNRENPDNNSVIKNVETPNSTLFSFKTANNTKINISKAALLKSKYLFKDFMNEGSSLADSQIIGFKTANNNAISISKEALAKTRNIFDDIVNNCDVNICALEKIKSKNSYDEYQSAKKKHIEHYDDTVAKTKTDEKLNNVHKSSTGKRDSGFKTAYNNNEQFTKLLTSDTTFPAFKTASNKDIKITDQALLESKRLLEDNSEYKNNNLYINLDMNCFETASNKPRKIQSHENNKKFFQDIDSLCVNDQNDNKMITNLNKHSTSFAGFQTASNKRVNISEEALKNTEHVFQDVYNIHNFCSFKTAADKKIDIDENALFKAKTLLQEVGNEVIDSENQSNRYSTGENKMFINEGDKDLLSEKKLSKNTQAHDVNLQNVLDTQIINNFEFTLNTEDFYKDETPKPKPPKRAGSPILSCPKAKKRRKFETPFKNDNRKVENPIRCSIPSNTENNEKNRNVLQFRNDYKKSRNYKLKDLEIMEKCANKVIDRSSLLDLLNFHFQELLNFEFFDERNDVTNEKLTINEMKDLFLNNVNGKIIPDGWLDNHLKLILWKLISYEIKYPNVLHAVCSARNVIDQLKYRYDKELYNVERSALRKILEKDDVASKVLVLCVVGIYVNGDKVDSVTNMTHTIELLLTDGWYCVKACIDAMLAKLVYAQKIVVGGKIVTHGAELINCEQGMSPWEDTSAVRLKLSGNSTRRARWDARLGYHSNAAILTHLSSVKLDGGKVSKLRVFVTRVYPPLYVEKFEDGSTVTRSERLEHLYQMRYESERQVLMEKIYEEVEKEFFEDDQESNSSADSGKRKCLKANRSKISKYMDHTDLKSQITRSQLAELEAQSNRHRDQIISKLQARFQDRLNGLEGRKVVALMKIRVAGVERDLGVSKGMLSIWRPNEAVAEILKENSWIEVYNVVPTAYRYSELQISAGRQSIFIQSKHKESNIKPCLKALRRTCYSIKHLVKNPMSTTEYNEIDTAGFIFHVEPSTKDFESLKNQQFQNVYFADANKNLICVNFWGGIAKFGYENVLDTGQLYAGINLQIRAGNTKKNIPHYRATEFSYFTKTPKNEQARLLIEELVKQFSGIDRRKFIQDCITLKNNYTLYKNQANENISPHRFNNHNQTNMYISPKYNKMNEDIFNLNGLDFESTFKQNTQELSPKALLRKKQVNDKIAKLKMYGEPPPLSPIQIINKTTKAKNSYKSPLSKCDVSCSVANANNILRDNTKDEIAIQSSPVLNRTYVNRHHANPVKLNFSAAADTDVDHFAEEFDGSPPLSLDCNDGI